MITDLLGKVVKVDPSMPKYKGIAGKIGIIRAVIKGENEELYVVLDFGENHCLWTVFIGQVHIFVPESK